MKVALFCLLHLFGTTVAPPPPPEWEGPYDTGITISAAANLPDGNIVAWSAWDRMDFLNPQKTGQTYTVLINPFTHEIIEELIAHTNHDMFCPGTAILPDGLLMVTGGTGDNRVSFYDYTTNEWKRGERMLLGRGYHSMTVLGDGSVFTVGGSWNEGAANADWNKYAELFKGGEWIAKPGIQSQPLSTDDKRGPYRADNHMWLFTAPNGLVFHAGPSKQMHWIDIHGNNGDGEIIPSLLRGNDGHAMNGNAVMYDTGKILTCGGAPDYDSGLGTANAFVIDIRSDDLSAVTVVQTDSMKNVRTLQNSVVLPTGEVVTIGGQERSIIFTDIDSVFVAEIWSPVTGQWTELGPMQIPRNYHAVALLMKDGKVWVSGSGLCGNCNTNHPDFEVLTPPYLRTGAVRPEIVSATERMEYLNDPNIVYQQISITMDTPDFYTFALIRLSADTHSVNNEVRRIPLPETTQDGNTWTVDVDANRNIAIPGTYFLFAMDVNSVPSEAVILTIEGEDDGPYTPPPEPTASPSGLTCFPDCLLEEKGFWLCSKPWGCEGCVPPNGDNNLGDTCENFCRRCEGRGSQYGGLNCDCPTEESFPTQSPVASEEGCHKDCRAESGLVWLCDLPFFCENCPIQETCDRLCSRCEGVDEAEYGGLSCTCGGSTTTPVAAPSTSPVAAPPPPGPSGDCFKVCGYENFGKWICDDSKGCDGCDDKEATCEKLCRRCDGLENNMFGGLDCDCPDPQEPCFNDCGLEEQGKWLCDKAQGCGGCDKETTCAKLCKRCEGRPDNMYGGLDCDCLTPAPSPVPQQCLSVCGRESKGKWICDKSVGCEGCLKAPTCEKLCNRCDGLVKNSYGGLDCDCQDVGQCFGACSAPSDNGWICNKEAGCEGCSDPDDICEKLCGRCGLTGVQNSVAGLTCDCP